MQAALVYGEWQSRPLARLFLSGSGFSKSELRRSGAPLLARDRENRRPLSPGQRARVSLLRYHGFYWARTRARWRNAPGRIIGLVPFHKCRASFGPLYDRMKRLECVIQHDKEMSASRGSITCDRCRQSCASYHSRQARFCESNESSRDAIELWPSHTARAACARVCVCVCRTLGAQFEFGARLISNRCHRVVCAFSCFSRARIHFELGAYFVFLLSRSFYLFIYFFLLVTFK